MGITLKYESDWNGILLDWVTAGALWMFLVQREREQERETPLNKKEAVFLKWKG